MSHHPVETCDANPEHGTQGRRALVKISQEVRAIRQRFGTVKCSIDSCNKKAVEVMPVKGHTKAFCADHVRGMTEVMRDHERGQRR
jgi:hypothetical protein